MLHVRQTIGKVPYWYKWLSYGCSKMPRETSQPISTLNQLTGFQTMRATTEENYVGNKVNQ